MTETSDVPAGDRGPAPRMNSGSIPHHAHGASMEIERTFLLDRMPPIPDGAERWEIEQGYFAGDGEIEGRLRRVRVPTGHEQFFHTIKRGTGLIREEHEREIAREEFERLWPQTEGRRLSKARFRINAGTLVWEIDQFHGLPPIEGRALVIAEVEIPPGIEPSSVEPPAWLRERVVREVTDEPRFRNYALATASATI